MSKTNETVLAERKRAQEINQIVRSAQLDTELADELIDRGVSADEARKEVLTKLAAKSAPAADVGVKPTTVELGRTHEHSRQAAMENAIANRISSSVTLDQGGREFAGLSLVRIAEKYLGGRKLGETDAMLAKRAMSTSDFPELLGNSANKALQAQFASIPKPYEVFARRDTLRDYKEHNLIRLSTFPSLQKRAEGGEFKYSSVSEQTEPVQLEDYGLILKFTKQMVVNDDLRGVARLMSEQSQAAARLEQRLVTNALITNSAMGDGKLLYHSDHGNIATETGDIGSNTAGDAFIKMGAQRSIDGLDSLGLRPRHVIVPPAMEFKARAFFATISPTKTSDTNPFQNVCEVLVDHNLADVTKYYWVADKSQIETVVLYNLEGQETPVVETRRRWEDSSLEIKVEHTATAKAMDWRGLVRGSTT